MAARPLTVAWFSYFPVEWLSGVPEPVSAVAALASSLMAARVAGRARARPRPAPARHCAAEIFERDLVFERKGVTFHLVKTPGGLRAPSLFWVDTILIRRVLRAAKPDVVHAWGRSRGRRWWPTALDTSASRPFRDSFRGTPKSRHELARPVGRFPRRLHAAPLPLVTTESRFAVQYLEQRFPGLHIEQVEHAPIGCSIRSPASRKRRHCGSFRGALIIAKAATYC